ncbi:MAG: hypothetical protein ACLGH3_09055 [Actinomycetota bacterium]
MARRLATHAALVALAIRGRRSSEPSPLAAVGACEILAELAEEVQRALVADARAAGHTWQEIGDILGTTRQAAFQRFGA